MNSSETQEQQVIRARHFATGEPVQIAWRGGVVTAIEKASEAPDDLWVAPTLFDVQVNGYGSIDFQQDDLTVEDLQKAARALRRDGCSRFLLTLITDEWSALTSRLRRIRTLRAQSPELQKCIVGWHIEGPFLSSQPGYHGAHNPALMFDPAPEHILELRTITHDEPLLLTVSPERPRVLEAIEIAVAHGIKVSLGHTNASAEIIAAAVKAGATAFTHLGNGCPRELDRHDNILWRVFETPGLIAGLIPDQIHVSPALFRLIHRVLPTDSIYYTTDAMSAAGSPPGRYRLAKMELEVGPDQIVRQPGKELFAGSALRPIEGVFRAAQMLNEPWQEVWPKFSSAPARLMGVENTLKAGSAADFCILRVAAGKLVELKTAAD
jgi:N-acetylglucosamine-6-phosphate deacetylase